MATAVQMIDYILQIPFDPDFEEVVQGRLFLTRSTGNAIAQPGLIEAYFDNAADREAAAALFDGARVEDRPRVDWLQLYQQSLQPLFLGAGFVVVPDEKLVPPATDRHVLVIPQASAFGTGSHESTALCIELLEEFDLRGKLVLDVGTGTGILALAMLRLGARKAIAFDIDLDAYRPLRENRMRNSGEAMSVFMGTIDAIAGARFDLVTVNILPEVIIPMLPKIRRHLGGPLILSGILKKFRDDVLSAAQLPLITEKEKGEWWAGTFSA
jgi:ribosomal protein L11 methyltransferase